MVSLDINVDGIEASKEVLDKVKPEEASYRVSAETDYAVYVEFGTRHQEAQPFMRRAVNQTMREADKFMKDADDSDDFVKALAEEIADKARGNAPVDTGKLQNSITVKKL